MLTCSLKSTFGQAITEQLVAQFEQGFDRQFAFDCSIVNCYFA